MIDLNYPVAVFLLGLPPLCTMEHDHADVFPIEFNDDGQMAARHGARRYLRKRMSIRNSRARLLRETAAVLNGMYCGNAGADGKSSQPNSPTTSGQGATQSSVLRRLSRRVSACGGPLSDLSPEGALKELLQMHDFMALNRDILAATNLVE